MKTVTMICVRKLSRGIFFLLLLVSISLRAQTDSKPTSAVIVAGTAQNRVHYILDLTVLPSFYEKALLLEHIFADSKLLIDKTDLSASTLDLFSDIENKQKDIISLLNGYVALVIEESEKTTQEQREQLSQKYNKYR